MAKIDFKENQDNVGKSNKISSLGLNGLQSNYFQGISIRPLDRLAHIVYTQQDAFSDADLDGFNTALECEVHQVRELVSALCGINEDVPYLGHGKEIDEYDLRYHYERIQEALTIAIDRLSKLSDLALASSYAGGAIASRLSALKGDKK